MNKNEKLYISNLIKEIKPRKPTNPMDMIAISECLEDDFESLQFIRDALRELVGDNDEEIKESILNELKELNSNSMKREIQKHKEKR